MKAAACNKPLKVNKILRREYKKNSGLHIRVSSESYLVQLA